MTRIFKQIRLTGANGENRANSCHQGAATQRSNKNYISRKAATLAKKILSTHVTKVYPRIPVVLHIPHQKMLVKQCKSVQSVVAFFPIQNPKLVLDCDRGSNPAKRGTKIGRERGVPAPE
jgi:hypothetical protein